MISIFILFLSYRPAKNLFSRGQMMNASFDRFHLVNTYGAFGSITRERPEIILEGTSAESPSDGADWKPYEFKAKPGRLDRRPAIVSPYHYKIDWQMWFAAMSSYQRHPWIVNLVAKLLKNDPATLSLLGDNPFPDQPPKYIRARLYRYKFSEPGSQDWWRREDLGIYLPPLSIQDPAFLQILTEMGWHGDDKLKGF
jgi:hypothetical protein